LLEPLRPAASVMKPSAGCWLLAFTLFTGSDAGTLRQAAGTASSPPALPWMGQHMLKAADQHVNVAKAAAKSSESSHEALLAEQQKVSAEQAAEAATDAASEAASERSIAEVLSQIRGWATKAEDYAVHAAYTQKQLEKLPEEAATAAAKAVEEQVRKEAYEAAERKAKDPAETDEARAKRAAEATAAAAEPYHLAILRSQKNTQLSLSRSKRAADTSNKLAAESMAMGSKANALQAKGETLMARQELLQAHQKMARSTDMKHWVMKFYDQANQWNAMIGPYQQQLQMALNTAAATFVEKTKPKLPPMPETPA